nr:hypothetical protein JVH1_1076 [Rhodococcus sp. JVH1]
MSGRPFSLVQPYIASTPGSIRGNRIQRPNTAPTRHHRRYSTTGSGTALG